MPNPPPDLAELRRLLERYEKANAAAKVVKVIRGQRVETYPFGDDFDAMERAYAALEDAATGAFPWLLSAAEEGRRVAEFYGHKPNWNCVYSYSLFDRRVPEPTEKTIAEHDGGAKARAYLARFGRGDDG